MKNELKNIKYFLTIGRFTRQKNHNLLIKAFANITNKIKNVELIIIGEGELNSEYNKIIKDFGIKEKVHIIEYQDNVYPYINNSLGIISTSLWEDPGFVMIEAAACNAFIISSDCPSGPEEFVSTSNGMLFKNNDLNDLQNKILKYFELSNKQIHRMKLGAKKKINTIY